MKFTLFLFRSGTHPKVSKADRRTFFTITHSEQEIEAPSKESREVHALVVKQVLIAEEEKKPIEYLVEVKAILEEFQHYNKLNI